MSRGTCEPVTGANEVFSGVVSTTGDTDSTIPVSAGGVAAGTCTLAAGVVSTGAGVTAEVVSTGADVTAGVSAVVGPVSTGA